MGKLRQLLALNGADRWLLLQAIFWLAIARLMLVLVPFRWLSGRLSGRGSQQPVAPAPELLRRIGWAVDVAARHVPWRADCFPQALTGRMLLQRRGHASTIHIGVVNEAGRGLSGHAWLTCGDVVVTGGADLHHYAVLHRIPAVEPVGIEPGT